MSGPVPSPSTKGMMGWFGTLRTPFSYVIALAFRRDGSRNGSSPCRFLLAVWSVLAGAKATRAPMTQQGMSGRLFVDATTGTRTVQCASRATPPAPSCPHQDCNGHRIESFQPPRPLHPPGRTSDCTRVDPRARAWSGRHHRQHHRVRHRFGRCPAFRCHGGGHTRAKWDAIPRGRAQQRCLHAPQPARGQRRTGSPPRTWAISRPRATTCRWRSARRSASTSGSDASRRSSVPCASAPSARRAVRAPAPRPSSTRSGRALPSIKRSTRDLTRLDPRSDGNFSFAGRNWLYNNISLDGSYFNNPFGLDDPAPGGQTNAEPVPYRRGGAGAGVDRAVRRARGRLHRRQHQHRHQERHQQLPRLALLVRAERGAPGQQGERREVSSPIPTSATSSRASRSAVRS